ncbi:hypothetical protein [Streptacidiphilus sp. PAMC 29251]
MSSGSRFPGDLVRAQQQVWASEAATRAFVLDGPSSPVVAWPLPRQAEYQRLRGAQEAAQQAVREHPLMAAAIADHHWTATLRALWQAARVDAAEKRGDQAAA